MTESKAYRIVSTLNIMISNGADFQEIVETAKGLCRQAGDGYSMPALLATSNAPKFYSIVTFTLENGAKINKFSSTQTDVAGYNECFVWIQQHTPFSFSEAMENQGFDIDYSDYMSEA